MTRIPSIKKTIKATDIPRIERATEVIDFPKNEVKVANCKEVQQNSKVEDTAGKKEYNLRSTAAKGQ